MILQSLVRHYENLKEQGKLPPTGWSYIGASYALYINDSGEVEQVADIKQTSNGKKKTKIPQSFVLPARAGRSNDVNPNFLADNSAYILGIEKGGKVSDKSKETFLSCGELHEKLLANVNCPAAQAVLSFFRRWDPKAFSQCPAFEKINPKFFGDGNIVFRYNGQYVHDIPEIQEAWQWYYDHPVGMPEGLCLVTGKRGPLALTHPFIKGVVGAAPSGAKLVSFNNEISYSDGHVGGWNAPISRYAAFAYTEALNYMLADREHSFVVGDISVVCWAKDGNSDLQDSFLAAVRGESLSYSTAEVQDMAGNLCKAKYVSFDESKLDKNCEFYVLGLSGSKSRISVRFFYKNSFGHLLENVKKHNERLRIDSPDFENPTKMSLWRLLRETKPRSKKKNDAEKKPTKEDYMIYNDVLRSILKNEQYPSSLYSSIFTRIGVERAVTPGRAAILKAYFLASPHHDVPESVLGESLNPDCENIPYNLGRMFSVLETIQWYYNPDTKDTIKNRFFHDASTTPVFAYPSLLDLSEYHLKRLPEKKQYWLRGLLSGIKKKIGTEYPASLNVQQQVAFYLGYYQQTQQKFHKTDKNINKK